MILSRENFEIKGLFDHFTFDPETVPTSLRRVVLLQGSWREMGRQYGISAKKEIEMNVIQSAAMFAKFRGDLDAFWENECKLYIEEVKKDFPEIIDFWEGESEGTLLSIESIVLSDTMVLPRGPECSTISAFDSATKDGKVYTAANSDGLYKTNQYLPAVICYPEKGNSFIAPLGIFTNTYLNSKGLVCMASAGQSKTPPMMITAPLFSANLYSALYCSTAKEALDVYMNKFKVNGGENCHIVDENGDAYIIEGLLGNRVIRRSGDYGEKDYLIATNDFLNEGLKENCINEMINKSSRHRYTSEEVFLKEYHGKIDKNIIRQALGLQQYYEDGKWIDEWEISSAEWMPDSRGFHYKTYSRNVVDVNNRNIYIMAGSSNPISSLIPDCVPSFYKLKLTDSPEKSADEAMEDLRLQLWLAEKEIAESGLVSEKHEKYLNSAKACIYVGKNYQNLAICTTDRTEKAILLGKAISAFCYGQCYAKCIQKDTQSLV